MFEQFGKDQPVMAKIAEAVSQMPPAKKPKIILPNDKTWCAVADCPNPLDDFNLPVIKSSMVQAVDRICHSCQQSFPSDYARVVCLGCREVVLRIKPRRDSNAFEFIKRGVYHMESCPGCVPEITRSIIIEKELFDRIRQNRKVIVT